MALCEGLACKGLQWLSGCALLSSGRCTETGPLPAIPKHLSEPGHEPCARTSPQQFPGAPGAGGSVEEAAGAGAQRQMDCLSFLSPFPFPKPEECFHPSLVPLLFQR